MLGYANGDAWVATRREQELSGTNQFAHLGALIATLLDGVARRDLGHGGQRLGRGLGWGLLVGLLGSVPIRVFFAFPPISQRAVSQPEFEGMSWGRVLWIVSTRFLFGSALFEE